MNTLTCGYVPVCTWSSRSWELGSSKVRKQGTTWTGPVGNLEVLREEA